jgi:CRP-like cAMP-binding protein
VESALERRLSTTIMSGGQKPEIRTVKRGRYLVRQGDAGTDLFLVLDGVLQVQIDADPIAELGPGAILGERAVLEGGVRTASLQARTDVRVAVARADQVDRAALLALRERHSA